MAERAAAVIIIIIIIIITIAYDSKCQNSKILTGANNIICGINERVILYF